MAKTKPTIDVCSCVCGFHLSTRGWFRLNLAERSKSLSEAHADLCKDQAPHAEYNGSSDSESSRAAIFESSAPCRYIVPDEFKGGPFESTIKAEVNPTIYADLNPRTRNSWARKQQWRFRSVWEEGNGYS